MKGVVCSGNLVLDQIVRPVDDLRWGQSVWVESIARSLGGNGASTSYTLGMMGVSVRLAGAVGGDEMGDYLLTRLAEAGVDTRWVRRDPAGETAASVALVKPDGERLFLHRPGISRTALSEPLDFSSEVAAGFVHYHLASPFSLPAHRPHVTECLRRARAAKLTTSVDTQWDSHGGWLRDLGPALPFVDYLFVNQDEATMLTGTPDPETAARFLRDRGAAHVVVKMGAAGCAVYGPGVGFRSPAFEIPVVDTTGAGDCFAGGFLAASVRGASLPEAARFANGVGALSVQGVGAVAGIPRYNEAVSLIDALRTKA